MFVGSLDGNAPPLFFSVAVTGIREPFGHRHSKPGTDCIGIAKMLSINDLVGLLACVATEKSYWTAT
jgi:hypothetical protein